MPPSTLPPPVREAAGRALWSRLLGEPQTRKPDDSERESNEQDEEGPDEAA
jgi:hypothetical protein